MSVNSVQLLGRLGDNPELRYSNNNDKVCSFSLATSDKYKDKSGNSKTKTEWHKIICWGALAENCSKFIKKGSQVFIEGKLRTRKWTDKNNQIHYNTEIIANNVQFLESKKDEQVAQQETSKGITTVEIPF